MNDSIALEIRKGFNLLAAAILQRQQGDDGLRPEYAVRMVDRLRREMGDE